MVIYERLANVQDDLMNIHISMAETKVLTSDNKEWRRVLSNINSSMASIARNNDDDEFTNKCS